MPNPWPDRFMTLLWGGNRDTGPIEGPRWWWWFVVLLAWAILTWLMWTFVIPHIQVGPEWLQIAAAAVAAYLVVGFGGLAGTFVFVEGNRWLFSRDSLRPYDAKDHPPPVKKPAQRDIEPRRSPRREPIATGIVERLLFTSLATVLLAGSGDARPAVLGAICAGYVALKGFKRSQPSTDPEYATVHSIWGSGVSLAFAVLAGWLFNEVVGAGK